MSEEDLNEEDISELPEYSPKSDFSKALKVSEAFTKIVEVRAKEMRPGYYNITMDKNGMTQKTWIPDARVVFIGAVESLKNILAPEILRDSNYREDIKAINERIEKLKGTYLYEELVLDYKKDEDKDSWVAYYKKTGFKIMPEIGDVVVVPTQNTSGQITYGPSNGGWDRKINIYRNLLVECYDDIFAELNKLIDRLNYFKSGLSF